MGWLGVYGEETSRREYFKETEMTSYNVPDYTVEDDVDGIREFLKVNLIAHSSLRQDA